MPILWKLDTVMTAKEKTGYRVAIDSDLTASAISKLRRNRIVRRVEGETLAKLCKALDCQPGDLMEYVTRAPRGTKTATPSETPAVKPPRRR